MPAEYVEADHQFNARRMRLGRAPRAGRMVVSGDPDPEMATVGPRHASMDLRHGHIAVRMTGMVEIRPENLLPGR
jgi:hypothetical protein